MAVPCGVTGRVSSTGDAGGHGNKGTLCFLVLVFCGCVSGSLYEGELGMCG